MAEYFKDIGLVVLGFVLGTVATYLDRRRRCRAHWAALSAEIGICERLARTYNSDGIAAPLYRLPVSAFAASFPALLADGAVRPKEVEDLAWFSGWVQDINRGLDNADSAAQSGQTEQSTVSARFPAFNSSAESCLKVMVAMSRRWLGYVESFNDMSPNDSFDRTAGSHSLAAAVNVRVRRTGEVTHR